MKYLLQDSYSSICKLVFILLWQIIVSEATGMYTKCDTYNIVPSSDAGSCVDSCSCITLSQFAANSNNLTGCNTALILLDGIHVLSVNFSIAAVSSFSMKSEYDDSKRVAIKCAESVSFNFDSIPNVYVSGLMFIGEANSTSKYDKINSIGRCNTAIVTRKSTIKISNVFFKGFCGSQWSVSSTVKKYTKKQHVRVGGAIIVSMSNVYIYSSYFERNTAQLGGALYAESRSNITIISSHFFDHFTICNGYCYGGVVLLDNSIIQAVACTFSNNKIMHTIHNWSLASGGVFGCFKSSVSVNSSIFTKNVATYGGVLRCYHCDCITVFNTTFSNNIAKQYGGVAHVAKTHSIMIHDSYFIESAAISGNGGVFWIQNAQLSIINSNVINNSAFIHGGAISCAGKCIITLNHSNFTNNKAMVHNSSGGALFIVRSIVDIDSCIFINNSAYFGGALLVIYSRFNCNGSNTLINNIAALGVYTVLHSAGAIKGRLLLMINTGSLLFYDSELKSSMANITIINNRGQNESIKEIKQGGGIASILSRVTLNGKILLEDNHAINGGGILAISSSIFVSGSNNIRNNIATDTGGGIYLYHSELVIQGETYVLNNTATKRGGGIHSVSSSIVLRLAYLGYKKRLPINYLSFISNTAKEGGGLCLEMSSKFFVTNSKTKALSFKNNSAGSGGAIFVADDTYSGTCKSNHKTIVSASESECFFQPLDIIEFNAVILEQLIVFSHNTATISGAVLFGGLLDRCTVDGKKYSQHKNFIHHILNDTASKAVRICLCHNNVTNCSYKPEPYEVKKGEIFTVQLTPVDQVNHTLSTYIYSYLSHKLSHLEAGQQAQTANSSCTDLTFQVYSPKDNEKLNLYASGPCGDKGISKLQLEINFLPCTCPVGFQPSKKNSSNCECDCDAQLLPFISKCNASTDLIIRNSDVWITAISNTSYLIFPHCPFGYCLPPSPPVSINLSDLDGADMQCAFGRSGKLCGTCKYGLSLSLESSLCLSCPTFWPALFIMITLFAVLAGIVLVASLLMFKLTVTVGTLNGLIFFANIVDANRSIFIPFHRMNFFTVFIAWLNLDIGFDVCYFKGMDTYTKSWIEFVFPSYVILLVVLVIVISGHSTRFSQLIGSRNPVATLATLILLSYTKLLQNIITVVSFAVIKYPNGTHELVWRPDASLPYLRGKHIPLFLVAVVILMLGIIYTLLLLFWQWMNQLPDKKVFKWIWDTRLTSFMDAYHAPYRAKYRYWTGLLLFSRAILFVISSVNLSSEPSLNLLAVSVVVACLLLLKGNNAYKKWPVDAFESGFYINILIFCVAKFYVLQNEGHHLSLTYISISASFISFICILCYHLFTESSCSVRTWLKDKVNTTPQLQDNCEHARLLHHNLQISSDESSQETTYPNCGGD